MAKFAFIFDMDGLMVDTEPLSRRAWEQVLAPFGCRLDDGRYHQMIGLRLAQSTQLVQSWFDLPLSDAEIMTRKKAFHRQNLAAGVPMMSGLRELQAEIGRRALLWAVATSSPRHHAELILEQIGLRTTCGAIAGGDEVTHGKPEPDIYLLAAKRLGMTPTHCIALEDSEPGCRAAAAAGMLTIAIPNGMTQRSQFPCAHHVYASLHDVVIHFDALLGELAERVQS